MCGNYFTLPNPTHPIHVLSSLGGLALGSDQNDPKGTPPILSSLLTIIDRAMPIRRNADSQEDVNSMPLWACC